MAQNSNIEWTHHTFNPWRGCTKVSQGCKHCYAETLSKRNPAALGQWGPKGQRVIAAESYWQQPLKWDKAAKAAGERHRVFCASMADVFEGPESMPAESWPLVEAARARLFALIEATPNLDWLLLTKRPQHILPTLKRIRHHWAISEREWPGLRTGNVWLGTSVEDQATADERIPHLLSIPAKVRFLSMEPLLGPVDLTRIPVDGGDVCALRGAQPAYRPINWVIVGGESGANARPMHPQWVRDLRDQCEGAGVPFFFKQWGEWIGKRQIATFDSYWGWTVRDEWMDAISDKRWGALRVNGAFSPLTTTWNGTQESPDDEYETTVYRVGKKAAGRLLDGREWNEVPS
jgi:protein gp37